MARDRSFNMDPIKISFGGGRASRKASNLGAVIFGCRILGNCSTNAFDATKAIFLIVHNNLSLNPFRLAGRRRRHRKEQSEWPVENESTERPRLFDAARKRAELTGERVSPDVRRMVFEPIFYASLEPIFLFWSHLSVFEISQQRLHSVTSTLQQKADRVLKYWFN